MDWKLLTTTFVTIFLAELGDKTQLATFGLAASAQSRVVVFAGAACALIVASAIAVLAGDLVGRVVPEIWLRRGAGAVFLLLGGLYLFGKQG